MTFWTDLLTESKQIQAIFGEDIPPLTKVDLHEVILHRDGPLVTVRFDLATYPKAPPKKWDANQYNCVQVRLMLVGVLTVQIMGWATSCVADVDLVKETSNVKFITRSGPTMIEIVANHAVIESVSAYRKSP